MVGGPLWACIGRIATARHPSGVARLSEQVIKSGGEAHLEVSTDQIDERGGLNVVRELRGASGLARSCSPAAEQHLCKLLLCLGRLRGARRTLDPDPSLTPPTRTAHSLRGVCGARWALTDGRTPHHTQNQAPSPPRNKTAHPSPSIGEGL